MVYFVDADWSKTNWGRDFVAEDGDACVAEIGVDELARDDAVTEEGLAVGEMGVGLSSVGGGIVPAFKDM